jgi:hypothetical protein
MTGGYPHTSGGLFQVACTSVHEGGKAIVACVLANSQNQSVPAEFAPASGVLAAK